MDIKRLVLGFVFLFSVLTLWNKWAVYNGKAPLFAPQPPASASAVANAGGVPPAPTVAAAGTPAASATSATAPAETPVHSEPVTVTTDVFKAVFDTEGAQLKHLELLQHQDAKDPSKNVVIFDDTPKLTYLAQTGLTGDLYPNHRSGYTVRPGPRSLDNGDQLQVVFDSEKGGVKLSKIFTFKRGSYSVDVKHEVTNNTAAPITPTLYMQLVRDGTPPERVSRFAPSTFNGPAVYTDADKFQKLTFEKIEKGTADHANHADNGWVALIQHFFVSAFIPQEKTPRDIFARKVDNNLYAIGTTQTLPVLAPGATEATDATLYSGPQETAVLEKVAPGFDLVKDYGFFTLVAKPIFWMMAQIHNMLGNWGWTIIVFTVLMKIVFFPLSASSFRSMAKMKVVGPKMQAIRERYKSDPQKMNQAMMELYKEEKVNPLGGCLPVLVQMPVFIALYSVLQASVETRNAPWVGWIHDLSTPDPLYILPALLAVMMFIQTKLNPAPPDPVQAKVMMVMPLVFSAMFFLFPSGVVLYYVINTVLTIAQQWIINNKLAPKAA
ncbi:MAG: membrane protein insertase YidC [Burkholderiaceae bacterium]|nr:membrane protein insertase YidC [Burkholderiaceae bacterium]